MAERFFLRPGFVIAVAGWFFGFIHVDRSVFAPLSVALGLLSAEFFGLL
jgi:hypothetical protein